MSIKPDIVLLLPHFNNLIGLNKSLSSITNVEIIDVLIVDDGSVEKPDLSNLQNDYPNINEITVLYLKTNRGIEHALNEGLEYISKIKRHKYIARLDCEDTCHPERFILQKDFLDKNTNIHLVGSFANVIDKSNKVLYCYKEPLNYNEIKRKQYLGDTFIHPSIMFRLDALKVIGFYPTKFIYCEDTALYYNFIKHFETANIPFPLINIYLNPNGITLSKYRKQKLSRLKFCFYSFTYRYFSFLLVGFMKNLLCLILGNKMPSKIAHYLHNRN